MPEWQQGAVSGHMDAPPTHEATQATPRGRTVDRVPVAGEHTIAEPAELFSVTRATIYGEIARRRQPQALGASCPWGEDYVIRARDAPAVTRDLSSES